MSTLVEQYPHRQHLFCEDNPHEPPVGLLIETDAGLPNDEYSQLSGLLDGRKSALLFARTEAGMFQALLQVMELMTIKASKAGGGRHLN